MALGYVRYLVLCEYSLTAINNITSLVFFIQILRGLYAKRNQGTSPFLVLYVLSWLATIVSSAPFLGYQLGDWRPYGSTIDAYAAV